MLFLLVFPFLSSSLCGLLHVTQPKPSPNSYTHARTHANMQTRARARTHTQDHNPRSLTPPLASRRDHRFGWLVKFAGLMGFAAFLSPAFFRIAWFYYTDRRVRTAS